MYNKRVKIRLIVKELRGGTYYADAVHNAGVKSQRTVAYWRNRPQKFSRFWHQRLDTLLTHAWKMAEAKRIDAVEKSFLKHLLSGDANAAFFVFYLCNRAPERWKHVQTITNVNSVKIENPSQYTEHADEAKYIDSLEDKDINDLCNRLIEKRKDAVSPS